MIEKDMAIKNLIYKIRIGSTMYGTLTKVSDEDLGGIFIPDKEYIIGTKRCDQVELSEKISKTVRNQKGDTDYVVYSLPKFIKLAIENNPNIIEFFYVPEQCVILKNELAEELIANRNLFLSKKAYHIFKGYSYAQRRKLEVKRGNLTGRTELVKEFGYDTKFAGHLIRLLYECLQLLTEKTITLPLPQNNLVRDIKLGKYSLDWILNEAKRLEELVDLAYVKSDLQYIADFEKINKLQIKLLEDFWRNK